MRSPRTAWPEDQRKAITVEARRASRYAAAEARIKKIVDAQPPLTDEQRTKLALILRPEGAGQ